MFDVLLARWRQGHRTMQYPAGPPPELPERFVGRPNVDAAKCRKDCGQCLAACPTAAIRRDAAEGGVQLDMGRCLFCRRCELSCRNGAIKFSRDHRTAATRRSDLVMGSPAGTAASSGCESSANNGTPSDRIAVFRRLFRRSLKFRQVAPAAATLAKPTRMCWELSPGI